MIMAVMPQGSVMPGTLVGTTFIRYVPAGGLSTTTYSTLSTVETEAYSPQAPPVESSQFTSRSSHRSTLYMTARLAPELAGGSSHVIATTRRLVPVGTTMSP